MRRTLGALAATAVLVGAGAAGIAHGTTRTAATPTLRFTAVFKQATMVDNDPPGTSVGDRQVGSGVLNHSGKRRGDFAITCDVDAVGAGGHWGGNCFGWAKLADGYITFAGESGGNDRHTFAVTGGSGSYRKVRGQIRVVDLSDQKSRVTAELIP